MWYSMNHREKEREIERKKGSARKKDGCERGWEKEINKGVKERRRVNEKHGEIPRQREVEREREREREREVESSPDLIIQWEYFDPW